MSQRFKDVSAAIYAALLTSALGATVPVITEVLGLVASLFISTMVVTDDHAIDILDREIGEHGYCSQRLLTSGRFPAAGIHFVRTFGWSIAVKRVVDPGSDHWPTYYNYAVYMFRFGGTRRLETLITGYSSETTVHLLSYVSNEYRISAGVLKTPKTPFPWQSSVIGMIIDQFGKLFTASVLISGKSGIGKSRMSEVLAMEFKKQGGEPRLIKHYNPTKSSPNVFELVKNPTIFKPCIVLIDEYDSFVKQAEKEAERAVMLGALDNLALINNVIVIATTNADISTIDAAYTRRGRFDIHVAVDDDLAVKVLQS
jgi:hypothetical protein